MKSIILILIICPFAQGDIITGIRKEFSEINKKQSLYKTITIKLDETSERGELVAYLDSLGVTKKLSVTNYGNIGKVIYDFYFKDSALIFSFVQEISYDMSGVVDPNYNPISPKKISKTDEYRYYFDQNKLIRFLDPSKEPVREGTEEFREGEKCILEKAKHYLDYLH